ncbi:MAG TPA: ABC transporter permease [Gemmatimonadaceae bacterium]
MRFDDILGTALAQIRANKLRSFFTLLGVIVSVAFLVAVIAIIQGMNAYVKENIADAMVGANAFQVRRTPINLGIFEDEQVRLLQRRPKLTPADAEAVRAAVPGALAVSYTSGWPTPQADISWRDRTVGDVLIFGITPGHLVVQDYRIAAGSGITELDVRQRRPVVILGADVADKLFPSVDAVGRTVRVRGLQFEVIGVAAPKGKVLGQSMDGFAFFPISTYESMYGRRQTTTVSVKMATAEQVGPAMRAAEEAMRIAHKLRPGEDNDFTVETSEALLNFWRTLTRVLFAVVPAMVAIGVVVGGIVIMNIMLMTVRERTAEIGLRMSVGATRADIRRQFLAEAVVLCTFGGVAGAIGGWAFAMLVGAVSPLPARVTPWSVGLALALGTSVGVLFGVYPAARAARLDPVTAMRAE